MPLGISNMKLVCKKCNDIIEGDKKGTLIRCKCKAIGIDENKYLCRIIGNSDDMVEIKEINKIKEIIISMVITLSIVIVGVVIALIIMEV